MTQLNQERLVRKEEALGQIREIPPPMGHVGLSVFAPFKEVQSDDVIFSYIAPDVDGMVPARAEDAESEMADKDDTFGTGRASVVDWAIKDHYDPSDVSRYREVLRLAEAITSGTFPLTLGNMTEDFASKLARDARLRRRKIDNRLEWMIWTALETSHIVYNDTKVKFDVDFGRPAGQTDAAPTNGLWSSVNADPIDDFIVLDQLMYDTYGVRLGSAWGSAKAWRSLLKSSKWAARSGLAISGSSTATTTPVDPKYLIDGWGPDQVRRVYEAQTGLKTFVYDSVYRTRPLGSTTVTNNRFFSDDRILFLPKQEYIDEVDDGLVGFGKTLTSPHPEGLWTSGYYEWEKEGSDPWGTDKGTGIKAFPVFPHLELTATMKVL